jgi:hypothetical protein
MRVHVLLCYLKQSVVTPSKGSATAAVSSGARDSSATSSSRSGSSTLAFAFGQRVATDTTQ